MWGCRREPRDWLCLKENILIQHKWTLLITFIYAQENKNGLVLLPTSQSWTIYAECIHQMINGETFYQIESKFKANKVYDTNINMCFTMRKYHSNRIYSKSSADYNSYTIPGTFIPFMISPRHIFSYLPKYTNLFTALITKQKKK